jgi:hypothetical protein
MVDEEIGKLGRAGRTQRLITIAFDAPAPDERGAGRDDVDLLAG